MEKINKRNKGITLIALIVTIIVLIILAGVAISMLSGDSGILNRASEASVATEIGAFKERVSLAQMGLQADISSKAVSNRNYRATTETEFTKLVNEVANEIGVTPTTIGSSAGTINTEGYTVAGYLDVPGENEADGEGYIAIWYSSNRLRSSIDMDTASSQYNLADLATNKSRNQAMLVSVIKVENYSSSLSNYGLTSVTDQTNDIKNNTAGTFAKTSIASIEFTGKVETRKVGLTSAQVVDIESNPNTKPYLPTTNFRVLSTDNTLAEGLVIEEKTTGDQYVWIEVPTTIYTNTSYNNNNAQKPSGKTDYEKIQYCLKQYTSNYKEDSWSDVYHESLNNANPIVNQEGYYGSSSTYGSTRRRRSISICKCR